MSRLKASTQKKMKPMERAQSVNQLVTELVEGRVLMNTLKEKIAKAITEHVNLEDTYTYKLTRVKSAFFVGTVDLEDFEEWSETDVAELTEAIVNALQPQLNPNQQIVLDYLKEYMLDDSDFYNTIYATKQLYSYGVPYGEESEAFTKLSNRELAQVLELFSKWAQEQEEKEL